MFSWQTPANIVKRQLGLKDHRTFRTAHALLAPSVFICNLLYTYTVQCTVYTVRNGNIIPGFQGNLLPDPGKPHC
jgi:hypothetical protein